MGLESTEVRGDATLTRTEALQLRGYGEDVITANGHEPVVLTGTRPRDEPVTACVICAGEIDERRRAAQAKTCADPSCTEAARKRRRQASDQLRRTGSTPTRRAVVSAAPPKPARAATMPPVATVTVGAVHDPRLDGVDKLGPIYGALMMAGGSIVHLEVDLGGERWTLTRSTPSGRTL